MTFKLNPHTHGVVLAAGLLFGVATAQAASGFTVNPDQEALVTRGMTTAEVQQALGMPAENMRYGNEPGPTFTYRVSGADWKVFDVDFGADGKVVSVNERLEEGD